jgi:hypothetical protein
LNEIALLEVFLKIWKYKFKFFKNSDF